MIGYGEKYYATFASTHSYGGSPAARRVSLQKKAYAGAASAVKCKPSGLEIKQSPTNNDDLYWGGTISTEASIQVLNLSLLEFYSFDDREWLMEVTEGSNLLFRGWIYADTCKEYYADGAANYVEVKASCGLKALSKIALKDASNKYILGDLTVMQIIAACLAKTDTSLAIQLVNNIVQQNLSDTDSSDVLSSYKVANYCLRNEDGSPRYASEVLAECLLLIAGTISQRNGYWYISRKEAETDASVKVKNYNTTGSYVSNEAKPATVVISDGNYVAIEHASLQRELIHPLLQAEIEYKANTGKLTNNNDFGAVTNGGGYASNSVNILGTTYQRETGLTIDGLSYNGGITVNRVIQTGSDDSARLSTGYMLELDGAGYIETQEFVVRSGTKLTMSFGPLQCLLMQSAKANYGNARASFDVVVTNRQGIVKYWNPIMNRAATDRRVLSTSPFNISTLLLATTYDFGLMALFDTPGYGDYGLNDFSDYYKEFYNFFQEDYRVKIRIYGNASNKVYLGGLDVAISQIRSYKPLINNGDPVNAANSVSAVKAIHTAISDKKYNITAALVSTRIAPGSDDNMLSSLYVNPLEYPGLWKQRGEPSYVHGLLSLLLHGVMRNYSQPKLRLMLSYIGQWLPIGSICSLDASCWPDMAGKKFVVMDCQNYQFGEREGMVILEEISTTVTSYTLSTNLQDKDGKTIRVFNISTAASPSTIPSPWVWAEIGSPTGGSAGYLNGDFIVDARGDDVWGTADNFGYLYRNGAANASLIGKMTMFPKSGLSDFAKVGIMYRESTATGSIHFSMVINYNGWVTAMYRSATGAETQVVVGGQVYTGGIDTLKIEKEGSTIRGYYYDGTSYVKLGEVAMNFSAAAKIGYFFAMRGSSNFATVGNVSHSDSTGTSNPCGKPSFLVSKLVSRGILIQSI